jgi:hypothetical protein
MSNARKLANLAPTLVFSAYRSTSQSATSGTMAKVNFDTEEFDSAGAYNNSSTYRFQPTIAGYYQVAGRVAGNATTASSSMLSAIYKNGSSYKVGPLWTSPGGLQGMSSGVSCLVYLNGTTDYVELWAQPAGTGTVTIAAGSTATYFQGHLVHPE